MSAKVSILKIDERFDNKAFLVNTIVLFFIQLLMGILFGCVYFLIDKTYIPLVLLAIFLFFIPIIYFNFIVITKRIWDIVGGKNLSVLLSVLLFLILGICIYIFPMALFISYFLLLFLPGRDDV